MRLSVVSVDVKSVDDKGIRCSVQERGAFLFNSEPLCGGAALISITMEETWKSEAWSA